jgi:dual oxidase
MKGYPPYNNPHIPMINPVPPQIHRPMNPERLFSESNLANFTFIISILVLGDPRLNENPGLLSFGLILFRWHNIQAQKLQANNPKWTDEELFQGARRMVIATLQVGF